ncbi:MAG: TIGR01212 family radical SAM protein [Erysipelotrichaceae bacterium]|nr:TIGR01212 family radical SAM protein [Erysipelotrichaceae bacterium]
MNNPFPYSLDNKRYLTWNYWSVKNYGRKVYKVPLDGPFSCPNRDGTLSSLGCLFCAGGSNAFPEISQADLRVQYENRLEIFRKKWPDGMPMAYFQSYSNTYDSLESLRKIYQPFIEDENVHGLVIATRSDCLGREKIDYLNSLTSVKPIWLELGLQSVHDQTLREMNRGHDYRNFLNCLDLLKGTDIRISVHLINGWMSENEEMMLKTAEEVGKMPIHAVKLHMLHVCRNTPLGDRYQKEPFELLSKEDYVRIVARQLTLLRPDIIIERLTGDGLKSQLLAPEWTLKKVSVINDIDKLMAANDWWQGKFFKGK